MSWLFSASTLALGLSYQPDVRFDMCPLCWKDDNQGRFGLLFFVFF